MPIIERKEKISRPRLGRNASLIVDSKVESTGMLYDSRAGRDFVIIRNFTDTIRLLLKRKDIAWALLENY